MAAALGRTVISRAVAPARDETRSANTGDRTLFNDAVVEATGKAGLPGKVLFMDPDVVIAIDTIDNRAGLAMWTREELAHFHLLRPD